MFSQRAVAMISTIAGTATPSGTWTTCWEDETGKSLTPASVDPSKVVLHKAPTSYTDACRALRGSGLAVLGAGFFHELRADESKVPEEWKTGEVIVFAGTRFFDNKTAWWDDGDIEYSFSMRWDNRAEKWEYGITHVLGDPNLYGPDAVMMVSDHVLAAYPMPAKT